MEMVDSMLVIYTCNLFEYHMREETQLFAVGDLFTHTLAVGLIICLVYCLND